MARRLGLGRVLVNRDCPAVVGCRKHSANYAESSGGFLPPSPPTEKATARDDQTGDACASDGAGNGTSLLTLRKGGRAAIGAEKWSSQKKVIKSSGCSVVSNQEIARRVGNLAIRRTAYSYVWTGNIRMKVADAVKMALDSQVRRNQRYYREIGSGLVEDNTTQNRCATGSKCQIVGICAGFLDGEHGKHANQAKPREQLDVHCSLPNWVALVEGGLIGTRFCRGV